MTRPKATEGKTSVRVTILGDEYPLRSATSAEETLAIAKQVDQSIREIMQSGLVVETHKAAILACLRMAGELAEARAAAASLSEQMTALSQEIRPWLPPAKRYD
jgi:cell division protein ZapA (FtsZ GTPase activity inhibitor)